jgi:Protein of unknown function (DUF3551)
MRMWYALSLVIAIALPLTTGIRPAIAVVLYPWCVQYGGIASSTMNCGFTSFAQCRATASGIGAWCIPNPQYTPYPPSPRYSPAGAALTPLPARNRPSLWRVDVWAFLHRRGNCAGFGQPFV